MPDSRQNISGRSMIEFEDVENLIEKYIDRLLNESTPEHPVWNQEIIRKGTSSDWNYIDGCMITAVLSLYESEKDKKYLDFADSYLGWYINDDGQILTYDPEEKNLDNISMGRNLFPLYQYTGREKYRKAMDLVRHQIDIQPRTESGSFWHKLIYPNQVWLDGLYMAEPFYISYETKYRGMSGVRDVYRQFMNVEKFLKDPKTGLYYHGYDESRSIYWADPVSGCSSNFWLRATGWLAAALVDTVSLMSETMYYEMRSLEKMYRDLIDALLPWQDESGMFWQIVNFPGEEGNYLETSGSALIAYSIVKAVRLGILSDSYLKYGINIFKGICRNYLSLRKDENGNEVPELGGICLVAGLGGKTRRDGSRKYYYSEPVVANDAKGVGPFLLAYVELKRAKALSRGETNGLYDIRL